MDSKKDVQTEGIRRNKKVRYSPSKFIPLINRSQSADKHGSKADKEAQAVSCKIRAAAYTKTRKKKQSLIKPCPQLNMRFITNTGAKKYRRLNKWQKVLFAVGWSLTRGQNVTPKSVKQRYISADLKKEKS